MRHLWKDLSVAKKLYAVFGVMAFLILFELMTLNFAMNTLSAVRAFVEGEALWSKSQKNAIHSLHQYALTLDSKYYTEFENNLAIPAGDHAARLQLSNPKPDLELMRQGFLKGGIHPQDINGVINLLLRFQNVSYLKRAVEVWSRGDDLMQELIAAAHGMHEVIQKGSDTAALRFQLVRIGQLNQELTEMEIEFSKSLGEGSRWLEGLLFFTLFLAVITVESTGLIVTYSFSRNLSRSLKELSFVAGEVGRGNFDQKVPVHSRDELGQLAESLNQMIEALRRNIGERKQAETANQTKTLFLAHVSHELRTPLGVMLGYIDLMKDPALSDENRRSYLHIVDQTGKNLNRIVNDILDISKVEAGHLDIKLSAFALSPFIHEVQEMLELKANARRTELVFRSLGPIPERVRTDRDRLRQILINLVNNALKFTESGRVSVEYHVHGDELIFQVQDTGVGISKEDQQLIFREFARVDTTAVINTEGAGLGLVLSRGLARTLGGDVRLTESTLGKGSTFEARVKIKVDVLPAVESNVPRPLSDESSKLLALKGKRILVVDDAPENLMLMRLFLLRVGMEVETADDGHEGVVKASRGDYDLILMDMQMPVMNGFDATRELRRRGIQKPIVAFTANAMRGDEQRCLEAGCNTFVTKPIEQQKLLMTLAELVQS